VIVEVAEPSRPKDVAPKENGATLAKLARRRREKKGEG
jgi:hypothetical protein